jgi:protein TonB
MEEKKSQRADLNRFSTLFLWLGLVFVLFITWRVIEYKKFEKDDYKDSKWDVKDEELDETLEVQQEQPKIEQPQQKQAPPEIIEKVEDEEEVEETVLETTETTEEEAIEEEEIVTEEEEEEVEVAFQFIEQPPIYPGCEKYKDKKDKLKQCMSKKIERFINRKFDKSIAEDLGATGIITINVQFIVGKDGKVKNILARSRYKELEMEAKRVISQLPRMQPGQQRGKPTNVRYNLPIKFRIE